MMKSLHAYVQTLHFAHVKPFASRGVVLAAACSDGLCAPCASLWYNDSLVNMPPSAPPAPPVSATEQPFVFLRLWLTGSPWRLSGAWMTLAGILAAQVSPTAGQVAPLAALLAVALAEILWSGLWWNLVPAQAWPLYRTARRPQLPYVQPGSPASRLLGWPEAGPAASMLRAGVPLALLTAAVAWVTGHWAAPLSALVLGAVLLGMVARQAQLSLLVVGLQAVVQVAAPFALGVSLRGVWPGGPEGSQLAALGLGYTALAIAVFTPPDHSLDRRTTRLLLAGAGYVLILAALLWAKLLLAAGAVGLLAVAPLLVLSRLERGNPRGVQPWMLAAVVVSAVALGLGLG